MTGLGAFLVSGVGFVRWLFADIPIKILALIIAVLFWFYAVLDRTYQTDITIPVRLGTVETKKVITEFETRAAIVTMEGRGRDLVGLRLRQPRFELTVPEGRAGIHWFRLDPGLIRLPSGVAIRAIAPESVELRLNEAETRRVAVEVPTRGEPIRGMSVSGLRVLTQVRLTGPKGDIGLYPAVLTETLDLGRLRAFDTMQVALQLPDAEGFTAVPGSVDVEVAVEQEGARIFLGVRVRATAPPGLKAVVTPDEAQIAVAGPTSLLERLDPAQVKASIKATDLPPGQHRLAAEISLPPEFHLVKCEPPMFDVTVR